MKQFKSVLPNKNIQQKLLTLVLLTGIPLISLKLIYLYNPAIVVPGALTVFSIVTSIIASVTMFLYLYASKLYDITATNIYLLIAVSYGLCSFSLAGNISNAVYICYAFFPILFLYYERLTEGFHFFYFTILLAILLMLSPKDSLCIWSMLFGISIIYVFTKRISTSQFLQTCVALFASMMLAAFRIFSYFAERSFQGDISYQGFYASYGPFVWFSRLLSGSATSLALSENNGFNIAFGMFFLILVFYYIANRQTAKHIWISDLICFVFVILSLSFSPIRYLISFGGAQQENISYAYIFVFYSLALAAKGYDSFQNISRKKHFSVIFMFFCCTILSCVFASDNFMKLTLCTIVFFAIVYSLLTSCYVMTNGSFKPTYLLCCLIMLELLLNGLTCTNMTLIPDTCNKSDNYSVLSTFPLFSSKKNNTDTKQVIEDMNSNESEANDYTSFVSSHRSSTFEATLRFMYSLLDKTELSKELETLDTYPTDFDKFNALCHHLGVSEDLFTQIPCSVSFPKQDKYAFHKISSNACLYSIQRMHFHEDDILQNTYIKYRVHIPETESTQTILYTENLTGNLLLFDASKLNDSELIFCIPPIDSEASTICFQTYRVNDTVLNQLPKLLTSYQSTLRMQLTTLDLFGLILTIFSVFVILLCMLKKTIFMERFLALTTQISDKLCTSKFIRFIVNHYVYILSFFIPFATFVVAMIVIDCKPFGPNSLFDQDGLGLTLPSTMDLYYNLKQGNNYVSLNGGYGYSLYSINPLTILSNYFKLMPASAIEPFILLQEGFHIGLCGLFMTYYMTHRLNRKAVYYKNPFLIVCACIYSMNAYMLAMHGFTSWYLFLALVPLTLLALDYLMYQKRIAPYIILLTLCIAFNLYHALYLCIFLVIWFFTYHFNNIKDFIMKGLRFGTCSLLCGGNAFFIIASTFSGITYSNYKEQDSTFPHPGLHTNYLNIMKQHMMFPKTTAVTSDDGYVSAYLGILACILLVSYILCKGVSISEKLRRLIPVAILYWCFNGKIMSYIWNGFHYQSKVPNRYAYLLMFLIAELSYDAYIQVRKAKSKRIIAIASILLILLFISCRIYNDEITVLSIAATFIFIVIYTLCMLRCSKRMCLVSLCFLVTMELAANAIYTTTQITYEDIEVFGDYPSIANDFHTTLSEEGTYYRVQIPSYQVYNSSIYGVGSACLFNSFVDLYQANTNNLFGYLSAVNYIRSEHAGSLLGNMLSASKFIMCPIFAKDVNRDLSDYQYIGNNGVYYILENPRTLSLGYYLPESALSQQDYLSNVPLLWSEMLKDFPSGETVQSIQMLGYDDRPNVQNRFYFTDCEGYTLSFDEVNQKLLELCNNSEKEDHALTGIQLCLDFIAESDGFAYILQNEYVALREVKKGEHVSIRINQPNELPLDANTMRLVIQNTEKLDDLYNEMKQNQLENITFKNNTITGTVDYQQDGYTFYSLAYSENWHAYIDGNEVAVEDPYYSCLSVKTPKGKHTLSLKYIPKGMREAKLVSLGFCLLSLLSCMIHAFIKRKQKNT